MITLQTLLFNNLATIYDAERQIAAALPMMIGASTSDDLTNALQSHLEETQAHVSKLKQIFDCFGLKARATTCLSVRGLVEESEKICQDYDGSPVINAALIAVAQKIEHHEIAAYGCLHEWAGLLKNKEAAGLLLEILEEEKSANSALTDLARESSNQEALEEADDEDLDEDDSAAQKDTPTISRRARAD
jgi:ferritin-like metal-binding protein YciE